MTLAFPSYRNSFHPAWLLLLVPPLVGFLVNFTNDSSVADFALILRLILAAALVAPLLWLRLDEVSGRTQRLLKELRMQMPGCLVALLLPGALGWANGGEVTEWIIGTYGFGCLLLGASAFGSEFDQRTLPGLLTQPQSRAAILGEKIGVLGVLLLVATFNLCLTLSAAPGYSFNSETAITVTLVPLFALCSGPLYSLLSRSTLAGLIFTVTMPPVLSLATTLLIHPLIRALPLGAPSEQWFEWLLWFGIPAYLLLTFVAGWRVFAGLQLRDGGAGGCPATGLHPLSRPIDRLLKGILPTTSGTGQLVRKEMRLHVVPWLIAAIMVGLWLLGVALRQFATDESLKAGLNDVSAVAVFAGLLGTIVVVTAGAACVAEERELGTLEWQLTQPAHLRRQWWLKVAVAVVMAAGLGFLLPATLVWASFDMTQLHSAFGDVPALAIAGNGALFVLLFAVSVYASSMARNTMKATAATAFLAAGLGGLVLVCGLTFGAVIDGAITRRSEEWTGAVNPPAWAPSQNGMVAFAVVIVGGLGAVLIGALLTLAGRNFRRLTVPAATIARQLTGVGVGLVLALGALGLVFSQLALLAVQVDIANAQQARRNQAIGEVRRFAATGFLTPDVAQQFGVSTNTTPEDLVDAVIGREGFTALDRLADRFVPRQPPATGAPYQMDPVLARRYGIIPQVNPGNATNAAPPAKTNPVPIRMDPEMMKRYGLQPAAPPR